MEDAGKEVPERDAGDDAQERPTGSGSVRRCAHRTRLLAAGCAIKQAQCLRAPGASSGFFAADRIELRCSVIRSRLASGRLTKMPMRVRAADRRRRRRARPRSRVPSTAAGSGTPQCAVIGWPGQTGQASPAALSQTVKTKSMRGAPGAANSSQLFERKPVDVEAKACAADRACRDAARPWAGCRR